jgi:prevent-host-death family protein
MSERTIGAFEAKTHLSRLLDEVEKGDSVTITKHGRPVARLVPAHGRPLPRQLSDAERQDIIDQLRRVRGELGAQMSSDEIVALVRRGRGDE